MQARGAKWSMLLAVALFLPILIVLSMPGDVRRASYATLEDAVAAGAVDRGWVPDFLPPSTHEIAEVHNLDLNTGAGRFRFGADDIEDLRTRLHAITREDITGKPPFDPTLLVESGYELYFHSNFVLAVKWHENFARFWLARPFAVSVPERAGL